MLKLMRRSWRQALNEFILFNNNFGRAYCTFNDLFMAEKELAQKEELNSGTNAEQREVRPKSDRYVAFQLKLNDELGQYGQQNKMNTTRPFETEDDMEAFKPWPNNINPNTGEVGGPLGPEPIRYGDWEFKGIATDF